MSPNRSSSGTDERYEVEASEDLNVVSEKPEVGPDFEGPNSTSWQDDSQDLALHLKKFLRKMRLKK